MDSRNNIIDAFRGVAVLLVTAFHIFLWSSSQGIPLSIKWDAYGPFGNGWIGVGIFFVISGYCMGMSTKKTFSDGLSMINYTTYVTKRFLRIAIPYYVSILFWVFLINKYGVAVKPTGMEDIITHLLFIHNLKESTLFSISGVYWSLAVEMQFYILLPALVAFCKTGKYRITLLAACFILSLTVNLSSTDRILTWSLISYLYLFVIGWVLFCYSDLLITERSLRRIRKVSIIVFSTFLFYKGDGFNNNVKIYEIMMSTLAAIAMWSCIRLGHYKSGSVNVFVSAISFIGKCSFSIYLYNYIFWVLPRDGVSVTYAVVAFLVVIIFGVVMNFIIERPSEYFRKLIFKHDAKPLNI